MDKKSQKTIQKRIFEDKQKVLENLKQIPIISVACQKAGVGRASVYRWKNQDKFFSKEVDQALQEGKQLINEFAESQLINAIKEQNMTGIIYWLKNNSPGYADRIELTHKREKDELSTEQKELVKKAIALTHGENLKEIK